MKAFLRNQSPLALAAGAILLLLAVCAIGAPLLPLAEPNAMRLDQRLLQPLSNGFILGTDLLGRDILSRLVWGMRLSIGVALISTCIAATVGSVIGILSAYARGWFDLLAMCGIDLLMAFPYLILALAIVAILGPGMENALLAIAIVNIPFFARTTRGATLGLKQRAFIEAARLSGQSHSSILLREILPNVFPIILITATTTLGWMILETAGLSFLGLGAQPPQADLGAMLAEGRKLMLIHPHIALLPGLLIFLLVLALNLLGDSVRDYLDPRLQSSSTQAPSALTEVDGRNHSKGARATKLKAESEKRKAKNQSPNPLNPQPPKPLLVVNDLSVSFQRGEGRHYAVRGISFSLQKGQTLGIVGESGSGKSVTALSLSRLLASPPACIDDGSVVFDGQDLTRASLRDLQKLRGSRIAYIFQDPLGSLHPLMKVGEQIVESIQAHQTRSHSEAREMALDWMQKTGLTDCNRIFNALPHELSGGQRQRIGIAMALANQPDLLIADEPTTALDVTVQKQVLNAIDQIRREHNLALLFISHDLAVVQAVCENLIVLYQGEIVESGPTRQILESPRHEYTKRLIASIPRIGKSAQRLPDVTAEQITPSSCLPISDRHYAARMATSANSPISDRHYVARMASSANSPSSDRHNVARMASSASQAKDPAPLFQIRSIHKTFASRSVVAADQISFEVNQGDCLGIIGESGSGKSTLARILMGLETPDSGTMLYRGKPTTEWQRHQRKQWLQEVQFVFQDPTSSLNPRKRILTQLEASLKHLTNLDDDARQERIHHALREAHLEPDCLLRYPHEFSGGQAQRIAIARALVVQPSVLILDEAVSALDVSVQAGILNLLKDLQQQKGLTLIFISHDMAVIDYLCPRILVLKQGRIVETGTREQILQHPKQTYTRELRESIFSL